MRFVTLVFVVSFAACGSKSAPPTEPAPPVPTPVQPPGGDCVVGGCSGTMCLEPGGEGMVSTCEYKAEYGCYKQGSCTRQPDGKCGWTQTPELKACLANPPPMQ